MFITCCRHIPETNIFLSIVYFSPDKDLDRTTALSPFSLTYKHICYKYFKKENKNRSNISPVLPCKTPFNISTIPSLNQ